MTRARILADYVSSGDELALKAPLASPAFTGTPTGITAAHITSGVLPVGVTGGSGLDAVSAGITQSDCWRITSHLTASVGTVTANWERDDSYMASAVLGSGVSESSGIFSFPVTGIWFIQAYSDIRSGTSGNYAGWNIQATTNNADYSEAAEGYDYVGTSGQHGNTYCHLFFDVSNTTNMKVRIQVNLHGSASGIIFAGSSTAMKSGISFIRLGDT